MKKEENKEYKKGDVVKKEFLIKTKHYEILSLNDPYLIIVESDRKKYLIERIGKCDYKKCGNACCKFIHLIGDYFSGFGERTKLTKGVIIKKKCSRLNKCGQCRLFSKKGFPGSCKQFPHPHDGVYHIVYGKCGFRFKMIGEIMLKT